MTKNQLKELIRHSIIEVSEEEKRTVVTKKEKEGPKKATTDISDNPFDKEEVEESKKRRFTVKEVRMWMKKLEENRYKKVYNSDARRVAWMVNNEGRTLDEMPMSMKKKWSKAQYGRERYLATEFLKSKSEQMNESKLRGMIREIIKERLNEKSFGDIRKIKFDKKDGKKIVNVITSRKYKLTKPLYKIKGKDIELHIPKKEYNKAVEFFMKNKLNPRG